MSTRDNHTPTSRSFSRPRGVVESLPYDVSKRIGGEGVPVREAAWRKRLGGFLVSLSYAAEYV